MTAMKQFIEKAIEGGWHPTSHLDSINEHDGSYMPEVAFFYDDGGEKWHRDIYTILLDPKAWVAAGKAINKPVMRCDSPRCEIEQCEYGGYKDPKRMFDGLMEWLWSGKRPEEYLAQHFKVQ